jgi:hypothetical protein
MPADAAPSSVRRFKQIGMKLSPERGDRKIVAFKGVSVLDLTKPDSVVAASRNLTLFAYVRSHPGEHQAHAFGDIPC